MPEQQPNVLFLLSDQHSYRYEGRRSTDEEGAQVDTPTFDGIAERGAAFDTAYCQSPLCTPSRISMLTGREQHRAGGWSNRSVLLPDRPTIPEAFSEAGYETCLTGKMHLGGNRQFVGFDHRPYGDLTGEAGHQFEPISGSFPAQKPFIPPDLDLYDEIIAAGDFLHRGVVEAGTTEVPESLLQEQNVVRESMAWLREHRSRNPEQPWFLCASFSRPHFPLTAPERYIDRYLDEVPPPPVDREGGTTDALTQSLQEAHRDEDISETDTMRARAAYAACVAYLDELVGEFIAMLDAAGFLENTIVVYTSDHGEMAGEHGLWGKNTWHEGSTRVPFLFQTPEHRTGERSPSRIETPVSLVDLFPTLCGLAAVDEPDGLDGTDLSTAVETGEEPARGPVVCDYLTPMTGHEETYRLVRDGQYKYVRFPDGTEHFFDLDADPDETADLIDEPGDGADALADLRAYVDGTLDFEAVREQRRADAQAASSHRLPLPLGTGNAYHMPDGRLVDADAPLYQPRVLANDPSTAIEDWPTGDD